MVDANKDNENETESQSKLLFEEQHENIEWPIPRLFHEYGSGYKTLITIALVASVLSPIASLLPTYMIKVVIDSILLKNTSFGLPIVPDSWIPTTQLGQLLLIAGIIVGAAATSTALSWVGSWAWGRFSQVVQHVVRTRAYEKIQRLGVEFFDNQQTGQILSILNNDVNQLNRLLQEFLGQLLRISAQFIGIAVFLFYLHWQLALVALLPVPILTAISRFFVSRIRPKYIKVRQNVGALNARIENNLGGIEVVKAYTSEEFEANRVEDASEDLFETRWDVITTRISFFPTMNFVNWASFGVLLVVGGVWILRGPPLFFTEPLSVGTLVAFLTYNQQFTTPLIQAGRLVDLYHDARASVVRIFALRDYDIDINEREDAIVLDDVDGSVVYDDVTFSYEYEDKTALNSISFKAEPGEFIGLVGPTGSGKTTLTKLLLRFYDPDEGVIHLDNHSLYDLDLQSLRRSIGYVSQEPYLFSGTVRENIAYGNPSFSSEDIELAAQMVGAHEFIMNLANGYETEVGQRGVKLSGGQRQRIAVARAMLKNPDILVLDEATSHVDNETEVLIQNSLEDLAMDRTTFVIAHRLSTVRHADKILVIENGEILERGTHEELLNKEGLYANLWHVQVGDLKELPAEFLKRAAQKADPTI